MRAPGWGMHGRVPAVARDGSAEEGGMTDRDAMAKRFEERGWRGTPRRMSRPQAAETIAQVQEALNADFPCPRYCTVYFLQRSEGGPMKIGVAGTLLSRMTTYFNYSTEPIILRLAVPGGQALESYFQRRNRERLHFNEWFLDPETVMADAEWFYVLMRDAFDGDEREARLAALRVHEPAFADIERLHTNGMTAVEIGRMAGMTATEVATRIRSMRALGFDMRFRRPYAPRSSNRGPMRRNGVRLLG